MWKGLKMKKTASQISLFVGLKVKILLVWRSVGVFKEVDSEGLGAVCGCLVISEVS